MDTTTLNNEDVYNSDTNTSGVDGSNYSEGSNNDDDIYAQIRQEYEEEQRAIKDVMDAHNPNISAQPSVESKNQGNDVTASEQSASTNDVDLESMDAETQKARENLLRYFTPPQQQEFAQQNFQPAPQQHQQQQYQQQQYQQYQQYQQQQQLQPQQQLQQQQQLQNNNANAYGFDYLKPASPPAPTNDPHKDAASYLDYMNNELKKYHEHYAQLENLRCQAAMEYKAVIDNIRAEQEARNMENAIADFYNYSAQVAQKKYNDYDKAEQYYYNTRSNQLKSLSAVYEEFSNDAAISNSIRGELQNIVTKCAQRGLDPAEQIYALSKNLGYVSEASDNAPKNNVDSSNTAMINSEQTQANIPTKPSNVMDFNKKAALHRSSKTIANGGGEYLDVSSLEDLDDMSPEDLERWFSNSKNLEKFRRLGGMDIY